MTAYILDVNSVNGEGDNSLTRRRPGNTTERLHFSS